MSVIAEGVETVEQALFLRDHGCLYAQGNLYSRPMTSDEVPGFLARDRLSFPKRVSSA